MTRNVPTPQGGWYIEKGHFGILGFNESHFSTDGVSRIEEAWNDNHTLVSLSLDKCPLTDNSVDVICAFIRNNAVLKNSWLGKCCFTDEGAQPLLEGLSKNKTLTELSLPKCQLTDDSATSFCDFLKNNDALQQLLLHNCAFSDEGLQRILNGLATNKTLQHFSLPFSVLSDDAVAAIEEFVSNNSTLSVFSLDDGLSEQEVTDILKGLTENGSLNEFSLDDYKHLKENLDEGQSIIELISELRDGQQDPDEIEQELRDLGIGQRNTKEREIVEAKAADIFFPEEGGILHIPGSGVELSVPPGAVPEGKVYTIQGVVHTDLRPYTRWMQSEDEYIIGPVPEYTTLEDTGIFKEPVVITIPHCLPAAHTKNIRVLFGQGDNFQEVQKEDPEMTYTIEADCVKIKTMHFTSFVATETGKQEEITDALITVAASRKQTPAKSVSSLRFMIHSGCSIMDDFKNNRQQYYDPGMVEIVRSKVTLPRHEGAIEYPTIYLCLQVDEECEATIRNEKTPKKKEVKVNGKNVLCLPKHRKTQSESLHTFFLDDKSHQQLQCSTDVTFVYQNIGDVKNSIHVIYPEQAMVPNIKVTEQQKLTWTGDLTHQRMTECIDFSLPDLHKRLKPASNLIADLRKAKVIGPAEEDAFTAQGLTNSGRIDIIMESVKQKGVEAFLNFCLVLAKNHINQSHIVTDVMGLDMDYIRAQRALLERPSIPPAEEHAPPAAEDRPPSVTSTAAEDRPPSTASTAAEDHPPSTASTATDDRPPSTAATATEDRPPSTAATATEDRPPSTAATATEDRPLSTAATATEDCPPSTAATATEDRPPSTASTATEDRPPSTAATASEDIPSRSATPEPTLTEGQPARRKPLNPKKTNSQTAGGVGPTSRTTSASAKKVAKKKKPVNSRPPWR